MKNKKFDCGNCASFCCIVPPMLQGEEELAKAVGFGVKYLSLDG